MSEIKERERKGDEGEDNDKNKNKEKKEKGERRNKGRREAVKYEEKITVGYKWHFGVFLRGLFILIYIKHSKIFFFFSLFQCSSTMPGIVNNEHVSEFANSTANGRECRNGNIF